MNNQSMCPNNVLPFTPSDVGAMPSTKFYISFVTAGEIAVQTAQANGPSTTRIIPLGALAAGMIHPIECARILSTGTTASGFVAYF